MRALFILTLFIVKFWVYLRMRKIGLNSDKNSIVRRNYYLIRTLSYISLTSLFIYLFIIRLILGWEFIGLYSPFLFYFFTSIILDAYYFGLREFVDKKQNLFITYFAKIYRKIKFYYYLVSIISYSILLIYPVPLSILMFFLPTIDSICYEKILIPNYDEYDKKTNSYVNKEYKTRTSTFYRQEFNFKLFGEDNILFDKLVVCSNEGQYNLYEKKGIFKKYLFSLQDWNTRLYKNNQYFVGDIHESTNQQKGVYVDSFFYNRRSEFENLDCDYIDIIDNSDSIKIYSNQGKFIWQLDSSQHSQPNRIDTSIKLLYACKK